MKLVAFTLENYRSIKQSRRLVFGEGITTLVGPNNEGKSNILRALVAALKIIVKLGQRGSRRIDPETIRCVLSGSLRHLYSWETDFPITLQDAPTEGASRFIIEFQLSSSELRKVGLLIGRNAVGLLSFELECGPTVVNIRIRDQAPNPKIAPDAFRGICDLVNHAIVPVYIPSVRTADSAQEIVDGIVERELASLKAKKEYRDALRQIAALERPVFAELSDHFTRTLKEFLPTVKRVRLEPKEKGDDGIPRTCRIIVNDGTKTDLRQKGDGIQSLAAMSLMRHVARLGAGRRKIILAVEEPETHLHSKAIYQIRAVLGEVASKNQVIITTHNPVFVNRERIERNILVSANNASPADTTEQIREILGIKPSENLRHAEVVLVVEGEDDRIALTAILSANSKVLRAALGNGLLAIDPMHGSTNLTFKLSLIRAALCTSFVFLDNDAAGKQAVEKAIADRVLIRANVKYALFRGKVESELEDFYSAEFCEMVTKSNFNVALVKPLMRGKRKWSERVGDCFQKSLQQWNDGVKATVKAQIAEAVAKAPKQALNKASRGSLDSLIKALEERVERPRPSLL